ncbi:hypothetical protein ACFL1E_00955 [Candidatus Omnitrophota bacterium]
MKKMFFVLAALLLVSPLAFAHPPSKIEVAFDSTSKMLTATIFHPVQDAQGHYIMKVDIGFNGEEIIEHHISVQDNDTTQTVGYRIPEAKAADVLSVEAYCNIYGTKTEKVTVE